MFVPIGHIICHGGDSFGVSWRTYCRRRKRNFDGKGICLDSFVIEGECICLEVPMWLEKTESSILRRVKPIHRSIVSKV